MPPQSCSIIGGALIVFLMIGMFIVDTVTGFFVEKEPEPPPPTEQVTCSLMEQTMDKC